MGTTAYSLLWVMQDLYHQTVGKQSFDGVEHLRGRLLALARLGLSECFKWDPLKEPFKGTL